MDLAERAAAHDWSKSFSYGTGECVVVANTVFEDNRTSACNEREIQEAILHALRAYSTGASSECAVSRGVIHAMCLLEHRLKLLES